ncbi:MAG: alpha/beta hydrolase [Chlamydiae bacterium]|nr:alpha/beta hydrolase [Chlamydiota bacterium]MBI3266668.1 alpha/beta hydrolase [Chlamydiota bacterium]
MVARFTFWKGDFLRKAWALEWSLRLWGGKRVLSDYFLSRSLSVGVPLSDAMDVFREIRSMEDWVRLWYGLGLRRERLALEAEREERMMSAASFWMMARAAFQMAQFPFYGYPDLKDRIYRRCAAAYRKAVPYLVPPPHVIEIPFRSFQLPGYLRFPVKDPQDLCVVILGGIDGVKEEMHYYADYFVARGFPTLYFDAPGLGESWRQVKMTPDYEELGKAIYRFLSNYNGTPFSKIGLFGISLGANMAVHMAASAIPFQGCVVVSPPFHPKDYFRHLFFLIQKAAYHVIGGKGPLHEFMEKISLEKVAPRVKCPMLIVGGERDTILPGEEALLLYEKVTAPKRLLFYEDGTHGCPEHTVETLWEAEKFFEKLASGLEPIGKM